MSVETATRTGRLAFRGLCMQHGYNSKRLAEERGRGRLQDTGDFAGRVCPVLSGLKGAIEMTTYKNAVRCAGAPTPERPKLRENNTKTRTTMVHQIADFINYLAGVAGLCLIVSFSIPPLIGWGEWQAGPLLAGALLVAQAGIMEEVLA